MELSIRRALEKELVGLQKQLRSYAVSLCKNQALADDLVQDAFVRALGSLGSFLPGTNMYAWMCAILRNQYFSDMRRAWRNVEDPKELYVSALFVEAEQLKALEDKEAADKSRGLLISIYKLLDGLPAAQRDAFWLVHGEGLNYAEVSRIQDCPVGTTKSRVSRARHRLLEKIEENGLDAEGITAEQWGAAFVESPMSVLVSAQARVTQYQ